MLGTYVTCILQPLVDYMYLLHTYSNGIRRTHRISMIRLHGTWSYLHTYLLDS